MFSDVRALVALYNRSFSRTPDTVACAQGIVI